MFGVPPLHLGQTLLLERNVASLIPDLGKQSVYQGTVPSLYAARDKPAAIWPFSDHARRGDMGLPAQQHTEHGNEDIDRTGCVAVPL